MHDAQERGGGGEAPWPASRHRLEGVLRGPPPYPMVVLPGEGGFWCGPSDQANHYNSFDSEGNPVISNTCELDDNPCRTQLDESLRGVSRSKN